MKAPATFKQADITRAVKAVRAMGLEIVATVIGPDGSIRLEHGPEVAKNSSDAAEAALAGFMKTHAR